MSGEGHDRDPITDEGSEKDLATIERERVEYKAAEMTRLPDDPRVGDIVVSDVGPLIKGYGGRHHYFRKQWVGAEGVKITSPRGDESWYLPGRYDLRRGLSVADSGDSFSHKAWGEMRKQGVDGDVNAALGTEVHVPAAERTRENTGTCAACWGNYKMEGTVLVLHGYRRPGHGTVYGQCLGRGRKPLETSVEVAETLQRHFEQKIADLGERLTKLKSGEVTVIEYEGRGGRPMTVKKGEPDFDRRLSDWIGDVERNIEYARKDLSLYNQVVAAWRQRPMPKEGEPQRMPAFFLK